MTDNSKVPKSGDDKPVENKEIEDFFQRLPGNFRWPKPNAEAVAAAVEAIQRISGSSAPPELSGAATQSEAGEACGGCGGSLPPGARFCVWCGLAKEGAGSAPSLPVGPGQHHFHHHYHHLVQSQASASTGQTVPSGAESPTVPAPHGRAPGSQGPAPGGKAETAARQVAQDWAQACNTRHIDDLLELYVPDATLIRSSVPPVRSLPAIREFLLSMLEAGLGDVELESLRLEMMGDIAMDLGRCKMLVPVAMGKRREERGKYLVVLVRQPTGTWKILADCWASDSAVTAPVASDPARKSTEAAAAPARKPR